MAIVMTLRLGLRGGGDDAINRGLAHLELAGDCPKTVTRSPKLQNLVGVALHTWSATDATCSTGTGKSCKGALRQANPLLLRDCGEYGNDCVSENSAGVEIPLGEAPVPHTILGQGLQISEGLVRSSTAEPVQAPKQDEPKLPA